MIHRPHQAWRISKAFLLYSLVSLIFMVLFTKHSLLAGCFVNELEQVSRERPSLTTHPRWFNFPTWNLNSMRSGNNPLLFLQQLTGTWYEGVSTCLLNDFKNILPVCTLTLHMNRSDPFKVRWQIAEELIVAAQMPRLPTIFYSAVSWDVFTLFFAFHYVFSFSLFSSLNDILTKNVWSRLFFQKLSTTHRVFFDKDKNEDMEESAEPGTICFKSAESIIGILYVFAYTWENSGRICKKQIIVCTWKVETMD